MILLVHLKFCWCILNFAGADFEVKSAPAKYMHQQNSAGLHQKIPTLSLTPIYWVPGVIRFSHVFYLF